MCTKYCKSHIKTMFFTWPFAAQLFNKTTKMTPKIIGKSFQNAVRSASKNTSKTKLKNNTNNIKKYRKMRARGGGEEVKKSHIFPIGIQLGAQGPPRWPQGASQDPFFFILGAPGCLPGAIFHHFGGARGAFQDRFSMFFSQFCFTFLRHFAQPSAVAALGAALWMTVLLSSVLGVVHFTQMQAMLSPGWTLA